MEYYYADRLESKRIITRFLTPDDVTEWEKFLNDEEATQFIPKQPELSLNERSTFWIGKQLVRYSEKRYGLQALVNKNTNEFIGQCGLLIQEIDGEIKLEVGYHILKKYWGLGFAPEAASLFMDFAFENNQSEEVVSIIHVDNLKSQKVALKNGLQILKKTYWNAQDVFIFGIQKQKPSLL